MLQGGGTMPEIPETPVNAGLSVSYATHQLVETSYGAELVSGGKGPLYFGVLFLLSAPAVWYFTKNLNIDKGLKLAAWLFPLFAGAAPFAMYFVKKALAMSAQFDVIARDVRLSGVRFWGGLTIPLNEVMAVQTCYGGRTSSRQGGSWVKYELNLVRKEGDFVERICLLCHADGDLIQDQAQRIARIIQVEYVDNITGSA